MKRNYKYNVTVNYGIRELVLPYADKRHMLLGFDHQCRYEGVMHVGFLVNGIRIEPTDDDAFRYASVDAAEDGKVWCEMTHQFHDSLWISELYAACYDGVDDDQFWADAVEAVRKDITGETPVTGEDGEAFIRDNDLADACREAGLIVEQLAEETWEELPLYRVTLGDPKVTLWDHDADDGVVISRLSEVPKKCYSAEVDGEPVKLTLHLDKVAEYWTSKVWMPCISFGCTDDSVWVMIHGNYEYPAADGSDTLDEEPFYHYYYAEELVERGWLTIDDDPLWTLSEEDIEEKVPESQLGHKEFDVQYGPYMVHLDVNLAKLATRYDNLENPKMTFCTYDGIEGHGLWITIEGWEIDDDNEYIIYHPYGVDQLIYSGFASIHIDGNKAMRKAGYLYLATEIIGIQSTDALEAVASFILEGTPYEERWGDILIGFCKSIAEAEEKLRG